MSIEKAPVVKAPWPPKPENDKFYRYPERYPVGKVKGESFFTIAKKYGLNAADLVFYNFQTSNPEHINWYLANYVGCPPPKPGVKFYAFEGAVDDAKKNTGAIFLPMFGEETANFFNQLGDKVVENYNRSHNKRPHGLCYEAAYARVKQAGKQVGSPLPALNNSTTFGRLWGSFIRPKKSWLELPEEYRGKGAAGAMAWKGLGTLVDSDEIWRGDLEPGAVIQTWADAADFDRVRDGDAPASYGHSFIFLNYVYSGSSIAGMAMADQGFQSGDVLVRGDYGFWVGANLD